MNVHLTPEFERKLAALSAETGRAPEALIEDALSGYGSVGRMPLDWSRGPVVESMPDKLSGAWVLKNTRMPVATIFENLEAGANIDDILAWYDGLDRGQVKAVIEFAARSLDTPVASR